MNGEEENLRDLIDDIYKELSITKVNADLIDKQLNYCLSGKHLGYSISEEERKKRKLFNCFSFFSKKEIDKALDEFFGCPYNLKRVARECVMLDEDDLFTESMDVGEPLGIIYDSKGNYTETSIIEVKLRVREWGTRHPVTKLPFDFMTFRLITDDLGQWEKPEPVRTKIRKSNNENIVIDDNSYYQISIFDLVG